MTRLDEIQKRRNRDDSKWAVEDRSFLLDELKQAMELIDRVLIRRAVKLGPDESWDHDASKFMDNILDE